MEGHHDDIENDPEEENASSTTTTASRVRRRRSVLRSILSSSPHDEENTPEDEDPHVDVDLADIFEEEDLFSSSQEENEEVVQEEEEENPTSPFLSRTVIYTTIRNIPRRQIVLSSIYNLMVDSLFDTDVFQQTLQESLDTYSNELFRKTTHLRLADSLSPIMLSKEALVSMEDPVCRICLETFIEKQSIVNLNCHHTYHQQCLLDAISHQHSRCPLCRASIPITERTVLMDVQNTEGHHITLYH